METGVAKKIMQNIFLSLGNCVKISMELSFLYLFQTIMALDSKKWNVFAGV